MLLANTKSLFEPFYIPSFESHPIFQGFQISIDKINSTIKHPLPRNSFILFYIFSLYPLRENILKNCREAISRHPLIK